MTTKNISAQLEQIEDKVMNGLKDFQRATVNRIDYLYRNKQSRVLVCDEVGLGKTLIARGVIAKFAKMQKENGDKLVKVAYICSNSAIAEQNINKLKISRELKFDDANTSRLSMQHLNIFVKENDSDALSRYIQLIPLTPDTSFKLSAGYGTLQERALMYVVLSRVPALEGYTKQLNRLLRNEVKVDNWNWYKQEFEHQVTECNEKSNNKYLSFMVNSLNKGLRQIKVENKTFMSNLVAICEEIKLLRKVKPEHKKSIQRLRNLFAKISIERLEPDLVIMDEFQRFKYLLDSKNTDTDIGLLTNSFFNAENVKMLLLSATPYKMYSTLEEIDESSDEHYEEFMNVMEFLNSNSEEYARFKTVWSNYANQLRELSHNNLSILHIKESAESELYKTVCRTERVSAKYNSDIIDDSSVKTPISVMEQDIKSFIQASSLLNDIDIQYHHMPVDYIKSCPYIMSYMREYKLKEAIEKYFEAHPDEVWKMRKETFWLNYKTVNNYKKINSNNARLENVMNIAAPRGTEKLLWIPPSEPYYPNEGVFSDFNVFSKTLIFSAWEMVPRMISTMMSYDVERRTVGLLATNKKDTAHYFRNNDEEREDKRYPSPRMNFSVKDGKPGAMTLFGLVYPSKSLSDLYNPIECLNQKMTLKNIEGKIKAELRSKLSRFPDPQEGRADVKWYYLLPMLLDDQEYVESWLNSQYDTDNSDSESAANKKGFIAHLKLLKEIYNEAIDTNFSNMGKRPSDLIDVLCDMVLASPSICSKRAYDIYDSNNADEIAKYSSEIARVFIRRLNSPESIAAVELSCGRRNDDAHWVNVLEYCKQGNIQAVFDEYMHLISSGIDFSDSLIKQIHSTFIESIDFRTTQYSVDTFNNFRSRVTGEGSSRQANIRTHFAVAFTKGVGKESDVDRKKTVRNAFNSPFRPFVLASTSIGQEGLDFHNYCRRIVHWNLPSNPIDIEQREGRINRFQCLAIRQNIAKRYGGIEFEKDVWKEMLYEAEIREKQKCNGESDLIPFWGLTNSDDMIKIERIVPMYPLSRDELIYERLIKILSLYRLTLGQARQEELLNYLFTNFDSEDDLRKLFINLSPFYKDKQE